VQRQEIQLLFYEGRFLGRGFQESDKTIRCTYANVKRTHVTIRTIKRKSQYGNPTKFTCLERYVNYSNFISCRFQEIALTRGRISQISSLITYLEDHVEPVPFDPSINVKQRREELKALHEKFEISQNQFYEMITYSPPVASFGGYESHELETADTSAVSSRDLYGSGSSLVSQRPNNASANQLDYIHGTVTSLKDIGYEINDEINVHTRLIEDIESKEDEIFDRTKANERGLKYFMDNKNNSLYCLWAVAIVLFIVFTFILLK